MRLLITAGPTREPIDAVRFIGNRSSGRMGMALAIAGRDAGHEVTLLLGPCAVDGGGAIDGVMVQRFETTSDLKRLLDETFVAADMLIMAAAVADYRPKNRVGGKLPRASDGSMMLALVPTPDLVGSVASGKRDDQRVVAFALEEAGVLETRALEKMRRKGVDAIVANPLNTMDAQMITPVWLTSTGLRVAPGSMNKTDFARWMMDRAVGLMTGE